MERFRCDVLSSLLSRTSRRISGRQFAGFLVALGSIWRLVQYLANRPLWYDEAALFYNLHHRTFAALNAPLDFDQAAPIGFLYVLKALIGLFGSSEYVLRLPSLVVGIGAVALFAVLALRWFATTEALIAIAIFSISPSLVYYSSETKPYMLDAGLVVALLLLVETTFDAARPFSRWRWLNLAFWGAAFLTLSNPMIFCLVGFCVAHLGYSLARRDWKDLARWIGFSIVWAVTFGVLYVFSIGLASQSEYLRQYWQGTFMPFPPKSRDDIQWFFVTALNIFQDFPMRLYQSAGIGLFLSALGIASFVVSDRWIKMLKLVSPLGVALFVSGFQLYPFSGRLLLFAMPLITLLIAEGFGLLRSSVSSRQSVVVRVTGVLLFLAPIPYSISYALRPPFTLTHYQDMPAALAHVEQSVTEADAVFVNWMSLPAFEYYASDDLYQHTHVIVGESILSDQRDYDDVFEKLAGYRRVWIVISEFEIMGEKPLFDEFTARLSEHGVLLETYQEDFAVAYCYELK